MKLRTPEARTGQAKQETFAGIGRGGVRQVKTYRRIAISLGPIVALLLAGAANWKVGGGPTLFGP
jgi:hypothetical protein